MLTIRGFRVLLACLQCSMANPFCALWCNGIDCISGNVLIQCIMQTTQVFFCLQFQPRLWIMLTHTPP